jgi:hypothetical protein
MIKVRLIWMSNACMNNDGESMGVSVTESRASGMWNKSNGIKILYV